LTTAHQASSLKKKEAFFLEADYLSVGPELPLLDAVREATSLENLQYDTGLFIERMFYTNMLSPADGTVSCLCNPKPKGFIDPIFSLVVRCTSYQSNDRWGTIADAYKYVLTHPEILRSVASSRFGAAGS
jgi:hypothetical protein